MDYCQVCHHSVAHFKDTNTDTFLCSKSCYIDAFYKLKPQRSVNPEGIVTYNDNGLIVTLYDKKTGIDFKYVDKLLLTGWTQAYFCGRTLGNRYLPLTMLEENYRWASIASAFYNEEEEEVLQEGVLGMLVGTEKKEQKTVVVDLLCSPAVVLDKTDEEKNKLTNKKRERLGPSKEDAFKLSLGPVIMDGFLSYIFNSKENFEVVELTALTSDLIPFYYMFGFVLYPTTKSENFSDNTKEIVKIEDEEEDNGEIKTTYTTLSTNPAEWYNNQVNKFREQMKEYDRIFRFNKENNIQEELDVRNFLSEDLLFFSGIVEQGYYMKLTREDYVLKNKKNSIPKPIPQSVWDRMIVRVDPILQENYYQTYVQLRGEKIREWEKKYPDEELKKMLDFLFFRSDLSKVVFTPNEIKRRILQAEKGETETGKKNLKKKKKIKK